MGAANAYGFAQAVQDGDVDLRSAITWHLRSNHYPPLPLELVDPCIQAIEAAQEEDWERQITLPEPITYRGNPTAPAHAVIEAHHLDAFVGE